MKKITTTPKANRRPARERKTPDGVQNQLSRRRSNSSSRKLAEKRDMNTTLEQPITKATEPATVEAAEREKFKFTRGELGKARRAFVKAGQSEASEDVRKKWLAEMSTTDVAVMDFTSSRLAKLIKGDITAAELRK
jgi:hypothetical protein